MGICWSEPPASPPQRTYVVENPKASAPPVYAVPAYQNPQYTYAIPPPQQSQQYYYPYAQPVMYAPQQQNRMSPAAAFVGGLVVASVLDDMMDPV